MRRPILSKLTGLLSVLVLTIQSFAQQADPCGTMRLHEKLMQADPVYRMNRAAIELATESFNSSERAATVYTIPVVVHIMHKGSAKGTNENISDAQIYSAITELNNAYRKKPGTSGYGNGVDTEIEFCLATKDPNGNAHSGINRVNAASTSDYATNGINDNNEVTIKALSKWDNKKYYNIWVVTEIDGNNGSSGTQGYAYFPGAGATVDGAVMLYNAFGYDPDGSKGYTLKSYTNRNRTLIHEMGHGLNLYHTFEGDGSGSTCPSNTNCATNGDMICDTPPHKRSQSNCVVGSNSCNGNTSTELYIHNYLDYSSDVCQNMFTAGQKTRMQATFTSGRSTLVTAANLTATGCNGQNAPVVFFSASNTSPCVGNTVTFTDESLYSPTSWNWLFDGGTPSTSTAQNPTITYSASGSYKVRLIASNAFGSDTLEKLAYINPVGGASIPMKEGFESTSFPPASWTVVSQDASDNSGWGVDGIKKWERRTTTGITSSTASAAMNNYNYNQNTGSLDQLNTRPISLTGLSNPKLIFKVAHKYYPNTANHDVLKVYVSTDCGNTFGAAVYNKSGSSLGTASSSSAFAPASSSDWKSETIDLTSYGNANVIIRFESTNMYGNNIFLDEINISADAAVTIAAVSNPVCQGSAITFNATPINGGATPTYQWKVNNVNAGTNSPTFTSVLPSGAVVTCVMTSSISGLITSSATSNSVTVQTTAPSVASVSIGIFDGENPNCGTNAVTFSATPTNGGTNPSYSWMVNNVVQSTQGGSIFTSSALVDGDVVKCNMTSGGGCVTSGATSNSITMSVISPIVPVNLRTTDIQDVFGIARWDAVPGASYRIKYRPKNSTVWTKTVSTTNNFYKMSDLTPGVEYVWCVRSFCGNTYSNFTGHKPFKTLAAPCNSPAALSATPTSSTSASLAWAASNGTNVNHYRIVYKKSTDSWPTTYSVKTTGTNVNLSGLTAGSTYNWRMRAVCGDTTGYCASYWVDGPNFVMGSAKVTSIVEHEQSPWTEVSVYPNPANSTFYMQFPSTMVGATVTLYDIRGTLVRNFVVSGASASLDVQDLVPGVYFLMAEDSDSFYGAKRVSIVR